MASQTPHRRSMVRSFLHLGVGQITTTVLSILLSALLARSLTTAQFGLWYLITAMAAFAWVVVDWGHSQYITREAARHPERSGDLIGSAIAVRTLMALVACPVMFVITSLLGYEMSTRVLATVLVFILLPQNLGLSLGWIFRAYERMECDVLVNVVLKVSTLAGAAVCLALGGRLVGLTITWGVAGLATLVTAWFVYRALELPGLSVTRTTIVELMRDGTPMFAILLVMAVEPVLCTTILFKMANPEVVGWYGVASSIAGTIVAPASILGTALYPRLSATAGDAPAFKRTFEMSFRPLLLLAVLGAAGTWLFASVPIGIIYGLDKFAPAAETLRAFAPVMLLMYVNMFLGMAIFAAGRAGRLAAVKMASVAVTMGLVFMMVPVAQSRLGNGGIGVMHAMLGGELVMGAVSWVLIREVLDAAAMRHTLRCVAAGLVSVALFSLLRDTTPFISVPAFLVAFAVLSFAAGAMRRADLDMLLASFRRRPAPAP